MVGFDSKDLLKYNDAPFIRILDGSTQERRAARRELKTLAKCEAVNEEEQAKRMIEIELREQEELTSQLADTSQVIT